MAETTNDSSGANTPKPTYSDEAWYKYDPDGPEAQYHAFTGAKMVGTAGQDVFKINDDDKDVVIENFNPAGDFIALVSENITTADITSKVDSEGLHLSWNGGNLLIKGMTEVPSAETSWLQTLNNDFNTRELLPINDAEYLAWSTFSGKYSVGTHWKIEQYDPNFFEDYPSLKEAAELYSKTEWQAEDERESFWLKDINEDFVIEGFNPRLDNITLYDDNLEATDIKTSITDDGLLYNWEGGSLLLKGISDLSVKDDVILEISKNWNYINSESGDNSLEATPGWDYFTIEGNHGNDIISNFDITKDQLVFVNTENSFAYLADVLSHASETKLNGKTGILVETGENDSVFLEGITLGDLSSMDIDFYNKDDDSSQTNNPNLADIENTYTFEAGHGHDTLSGFDVKTDMLDLTATEIDFTDRESILQNAFETSKSGVEGLLIQTGTDDSVFIEGIGLGHISQMHLLLDLSENQNSVRGKTTSESIGVGTGDDVVAANDGDDIVYGGSGNDFISGEQGNDTLFGGAGNDTIQGGQDNDVLYGGADNDLLSGGSGADTFYFKAGHGSDKITDFNTNEDTLYLTNTAIDFTDLDSVIKNATETKVDGEQVLLITTGEDEGVLLQGLKIEDIATMNLVL